jgi:hypothetical protein
MNTRQKRAIPNSASAPPGPQIGLAVSPGGGRVAFPLDIECCGQQFTNENGKEFVDHWERHGWGGCVLYCSRCNGSGSGATLSGSLRGRIAHYKNCTARVIDQGATPATEPGVILEQEDGIMQTEPVTDFRCAYCSTFRGSSYAGLKLHEHSAHGKKVNESRKSIQKKNVRWCDDDLLLLASCELDLIESGEIDRSCVNQQLERLLSERGWVRRADSTELQRAESIRCIRKATTQRYKRVFEEQREIRTIKSLKCCCANNQLFFNGFYYNCRVK